MKDKTLKHYIKVSKAGKTFNISRNDSGYHISQVDAWSNEIEMVVRDLVERVKALSGEKEKLLREREIHKTEADIHNTNKNSGRFAKMFSGNNQHHHLVKRVSELESEIHKLNQRIEILERHLNSKRN